MRSLPLDRANSRNASVTMQQTVWIPRSALSVLQHPSLNHPVRGSSEQVSNVVPRTLSDGSMHHRWGLYP